MKEKIRMRLDVGCGNTPKGDVNCDLYIHDKLNHRNLGSDILNPKEISNFVLCSGLNLPFQTGAFTEVISCQTIEHIKTPQRFLAELCRVSKRTVIVETVHRIGEGLSLSPKHRRWFREHHISKFNVRWFQKVARLYGFRVQGSITLNYHFVPNHLFRLFAFPYEIQIKMVRDTNENVFPFS